MKFRIPKNIPIELKDDDRPTIMIIDDELKLLKELEKLLSGDYKIITALNGQEALKKLQCSGNPEEISLIISDQRMPPGMSGVELLTILAQKQIMPDTVRIILTGFDDKEVILNAINDAHIYKFLMKPYDPDVLSLAIQRAVESFYHQQELKKFRDDIMEKNAKIAELEKQLEDLKTSIKN